MIEETGIGWVCENADGALCEALDFLIGNPEIIRYRHDALLGMTFCDDLAVGRFEEMLGGDCVCQG